MSDFNSRVFRFLSLFGFRVRVGKYRISNEVGQRSGDGTCAAAGVRAPLAGVPASGGVLSRLLRSDSAGVMLVGVTLRVTRLLP